MYMCFPYGGDAHLCCFPYRHKHTSYVRLLNIYCPLAKELQSATCNDNEMLKVTVKSYTPHDQVKPDMIDALIVSIKLNFDTGH